MIAGQWIKAGSPLSPMGRVATARANREAREARAGASAVSSRLVALMNSGMTNAEAAAVINREAIPLRLEQARENVEIAREMLADAEAELTEAETAAQAVAP